MFMANGPLVTAVWSYGRFHHQPPVAGHRCFQLLTVTKTQQFREHACVFLPLGDDLRVSPGLEGDAGAEGPAFPAGPANLHVH